MKSSTYLMAFVWVTWLCNETFICLVVPEKDHLFVLKASISCSTLYLLFNIHQCETIYVSHGICVDHLLCNETFICLVASKRDHLFVLKASISCSTLCLLYNIHQCEIIHISHGICVGHLVIKDPLKRFMKALWRHVVIH